MSSDPTPDKEQLRRWRLVLGEAANESCGALATNSPDIRIDNALTALYDADSKTHLRGGSGSSSPRVARWLGDIRQYFPASIVQVMQKDAFERLDLKSILFEKEML